MTVLDATLGPKFSSLSALLLDPACFSTARIKTRTLARNPYHIRRAGVRTDGTYRLPLFRTEVAQSRGLFSCLSLTKCLPAAARHRKPRSRNSTRNLPCIALMHGSHVSFLFSKKHGSHNLVSLKPLSTAFFPHTPPARAVII